MYNAGERVYPQVDSPERQGGSKMVISKQATTYEVDIEDVEYLRHGDTPLLARLFRPKGSGPFPIMVELHGGAWVRGDRLIGNAANEAHPRPDLDEFIAQYRRAGGNIDVKIFEGEGERLLQDISTPDAQEALERMTAFIHQHMG